MAEIKDTVVKKQVQKQPASTATKPKVNSSNKDIAVFGKLSTANKTSEKTSSSETLSKRLSGAQGEAPKAESKEVKRNDAQVSVSAFGSLTGIKSDNTKAQESSSIFSRLNSAQEAQAATNPVKTSDVATTKEALEKENAATGNKFDSDNFAAFNDDAPQSENCGQNNQAMIQKRRVDQYGGYMPGQIPNYTNVTKPNVHRNNVIDVVNRYNTGTTRSAFQRQIEYDYRDAMGLKLSVGGSSGCGGGCSGTSSSNSGCSGTTSSSSKHHKKHKGISAGAAIAIGLGAGLGGLALGGLAAWGISKAASSGVEAAKGGSGAAGAVASAGSGAAGTVARAGSSAKGGAGTAGAAGTVASTAVSGESARGNNLTLSNTNNNKHGINIPDTSSVQSGTKSVISDLKNATPENANQVLAKADQQYVNLSSAIGTNDAAQAQANQTLGATEGQLEAVRAESKDCSSNIEAAQAVITDKENRITKQEELISKLDGQAQEYTRKADGLKGDIEQKSNDIKACESSISSLEQQLGQTTDSTQRSNLNKQITEKKAEKKRLEEEKGKLEGEKTEYENKAKQITDTDKPEAEKVKDTLKTEKVSEEEKKSTLESQLSKYKRQEDQYSMQKANLKRNIEEIKDTQKTLTSQGTELNDAREDLAKQMNKTFQTEVRGRSSIGTFFNSSKGNDYTIGAASNIDGGISASQAYTNALNPSSNITGTQPATTAANTETTKPAANGGTSTPQPEAAAPTPESTPANDEIKSADGKTKLAWAGEGLMNSETGEYFTGDASDGLHYSKGQPATGEAEDGKYYNEGKAVNETTIECNGEKVYCIDGYPTCGTDNDGVHYGTDGRQMSMMQTEDGFVDDSGKLANGFYNGTLYKDGQDVTQNTLGDMNYIIENLGEGETTTYASIANDAGLGDMKNTDAFIEANKGNLLELPKPQTPTDK